jgi:glycosyltransferase involved in cell wall biosynthesis
MRVSIIIPTYNRASFIEKTVRSLCAQTSSDYEIIVVDDGSTDNTQQVVEAIRDPRIRYFKKDNAERGAARNYGADRAMGDYINFFDSDDLAYDCHVSTAIGFIEKMGNPEVFHQNYDVKDLGGKVLSKKRHITDLFDQFRFTEDRRVSGSEDFLLWLQLSFAFGIHHVDKVTSTIIEHDNRSVITTDVPKLIERKTQLIAQLVQSCNGNPIFLKNKNVIICHNYLYVSLHLALLKKGFESLTYLWKGLKLYPLCIFSTKPLIIFKKLIF